MTIQNYTGLYRTIQDYVEEYRGLNRLLDISIKTVDRQTDTHTQNINIIIIQTGNGIISLISKKTSFYQLYKKEAEFSLRLILGN